MIAKYGDLLTQVQIDYKPFTQCAVSARFVTERCPINNWAMDYFVVSSGWQHNESDAWDVFSAKCKEHGIELFGKSVNMLQISGA